MNNSQTCNKRQASAWIMGLALLGTLTGCAVGPDYRRPAVQLPETWSATQSGTLADPGNWWARFDDPALNALIAAAQQDNPGLDKATAAIAKARAARTEAGSAFAPDIDANAKASSAGSFKHSSNLTRGTQALLDAAWELDLVGKTRRATESATALVAAREADWQAAQVSLTAEVAADYVEYRAARLKQQYYEQQAASQAKTSQLTAIAAAAGFKAPADAQLAAAAAASLRSTALDQQAAGELAIKSLVALSGLSEAEVRRQLGDAVTGLPQPQGLRVTELPANLLRQRPDIVAAERALASANALIGVAKAAQWPSLTLNGSVGLASTRGTASTAPWSFGPSLNLPLFDGGSIQADIKSAEADYDTALAAYKQTVRDAVKEVEQTLVKLDSAAARASQEQASAEGYRAYLKAAEQNWRAGGLSQLDLEIARRSAISAEVSLLELKQNRLLYWISLYKAVGGGWPVSQGESE